MHAALLVSLVSLVVKTLSIAQNCARLDATVSMGLCSNWWRVANLDRMARWVAIVLAVPMSGCLTLAELGEHAHDFHASDYAWSLRSGANQVTVHVSGADLHGVAVGCAGQPAVLVPDGPATMPSVGAYEPTVFISRSEYYTQVQYPSRGLSSSRDYADGELKPYARRSTCDEKSEAKFADLPDGAYYINVRLNEHDTAYKKLNISGGVSLDIDLVEVCKRLEDKPRGWSQNRCDIAPFRGPHAPRF